MRPDPCAHPGEITCELTIAAVNEQAIGFFVAKTNISIG
jgi:hypothetical protein